MSSCKSGKCEGCALGVDYGTDGARLHYELIVAALKEQLAASEHARNEWEKNWAEARAELQRIRVWAREHWCGQCLDADKGGVRG